MPAKDHYQVLQVPPSATNAEIKKAFRRLAQRYHPDKNTGEHTRAVFAAVLTAYETLSDEKKRAAYNYERFSERKGFTDTYSYSVDDLLLNAGKISRFVENNSAHTIDRDMLFFRWQLLFSAERICFDEKIGNGQLNGLVQLMQPSLEILSYKSALHIIQAARTLLNSSDSGALMELSHHLRLRHYWNRYKMLVVFAVALVVCAFIYFASK